jgi:hypothetical protein
MMGKSHLVISTGVALSAMSLLGLEITLPAVAVAVVSSLLPDIDEPNSLLVRKAVPEFLLRILQVALIGAAIYLYFAGIAAPPWNIALALLVWQCLLPAGPQAAASGHAADRAGAVCVLRMPMIRGTTLPPACWS